MMPEPNNPIMPAPAGYLVDLENPQRRDQTTITCVGVVEVLFATISLIIRVCTKLVFVKKVSLDGYEFHLKHMEESSLI
jgi:hypothetical protein